MFSSVKVNTSIVTKIVLNYWLAIKEHSKLLSDYCKTVWPQARVGRPAKEGVEGARDVPDDGQQEHDHLGRAALQHQRQVHAEQGGCQLHAQSRSPDLH